MTSALDDHGDHGSDLQPVTLANWREAPYSRRAFHHVRDIIPCAPVEISRAAASALPVAPVSFNAFRLPARDGRSLSMEEFLEVTVTDAFVVLHEGKLVFEYYDGGTTSGTPHIIMSATKSITGLVAGILCQQGLLDAEAPVSAYVPEIVLTPYQDATIRQLLDMRTGIIFDGPAQQAYEDAAGWSPVPAARPSIGLHDFFASLAVAPGEHGGPFRYVSANTDLLGWVIERAAGQPFASLLGSLLWQPMGAQAEACITLDRNGAPRCTGGLCATARDLARVGQLLVQGGRNGTTQVVSGDWIDDLVRGGDRDAWRNGEFSASFGRQEMSYRSGWYVVHGVPSMLFAMGIYGQNLFVDRANGIVIAKLSSQPSPIDPAAIALTHRAVGEIRRHLVDGTRAAAS